MSDPSCSSIVDGKPCGLDSGGGIDPGDCCFVYDPGGVAGGNVFTSFAPLAAALATAQGEKTIFVPSSAAIPAGAYALNNSWFVGPASSAVTLTFADGASVSGLIGIRQITLTQAVPSASSNITLTAGETFYVGTRAIVASALGAAMPMINAVLGGTVRLEIGADSFLAAASAADPVVAVGLGITLLVRNVGGGYTANVFTGAGTVRPIVGGESLANPDVTTQPGLVGAGGALDLQRAPGNDKEFRSHVAPGPLPPMEPDSSYWVQLLADGALPDAAHQVGPGHYVAVGGSRTITLDNPANSLNGVVDGQLVIPENGYTAIKSDKAGAWRTFQWSTRRVITSGNVALALPAGVEVWSAVTGTINIAAVLGFLAGQLQSRAARVLGVGFRSSLAVVAADLSAVIRINLGPVLVLGVFPAVPPGVSTGFMLPIGTPAAPGPNFAAGDFVEIGVRSAAGMPAAIVTFTAETGFA